MKIVIIYSPSSSSKPVWMSLFCWTQRKIFWRMWETEPFWGTIDFHSIWNTIVFFFPTMEVNGAPKQPGYKLSSKYLPLCSAEQRNSYRFGTTWGRVNDDRIYIFGWTIPLISKRSTIGWGCWHFSMILKEFSGAHRGCDCLIKNKVKTVILWNIITI